MLTHTRISVALALACLGPVCTTFAATRTVGQPNTPCPGAHYTTIMAAVNAAAPGDTIAVCPALYAEQLLITKPLTLRGISVNGVDRVLVQPASMSPLGGLSSEAVITVMNTAGVSIQNLAVDATNNGVSGCTLQVAGIHYYNASGDVENNAIFGALVNNPQSCPTIPQLLLYGSGFGVQVDADEPGTFQVNVVHNSIHDYTRNGVLVVGSGVSANVTRNTISGIGPAIGVFQFGVFISTGAFGQVSGNEISEGLCGALAPLDCYNTRSEGVVLRAAADGSVVEGNTISKAQSGVFLNGGNAYRVAGNTISNIQGLNGIDIQGSAAGQLTNSLVVGNVISNVGPVNQWCSDNGLCCGIEEYPGTGVSGNTIRENTVSDAYIGLAFVEADHVADNSFFNALYKTLDNDVYAAIPDPPATEP